MILSELATGHIIRINESFARVSGWSQEEALGKTLTELNAWAAPEDRDRLLELVVDTKHTSTVELRLRGKSGTEIWMLASGAIVELDGVAHVLVQAIDITERKHGEQALERYRHLLENRVEERSERLRESGVKLQEKQRLAMVGTLTAGIAHQINNPIGGIMAAAELALLSDDSPDREMLRTRALETTVEEAGRCGRGSSATCSNFRGMNPLQSGLKT
jgi:PAS domain S-box-containing protein